MALFTRYVEPGRLCRINYGPENGKLCTIIDIINQNRVLVDGPVAVTGVERQAIPMKWISLTDFKCDVYRGVKAKALKKALAESGAVKKFEESGWGKKIAAKAKKAKLTDFERFRVMVAKKTKAKLISKKGGK